MCVAVPLKVLEVAPGPVGGVAVVDAGGVRREVPLDVVDRVPEPGEYVLVHAGFAIHTLTHEAGEEALALFSAISEGGRG